ncbi:MAG: hypothetical protein ACFCU8_08975 [Thermosynechococcaceae cyanobacterium]
MADLPESLVAQILKLQQRLLKIINESTRLALMIFEQFGETEATIPELDELQNVTERATSCYTRLSRLMLQIAESQPLATSATLNLLTESIVQTEVIVDVCEASNRDVQRNWNLS